MTCVDFQESDASWHASVTVSPILEPRIMSALERGLVAKGYRLAEVPDDADFVLSFTIGSREDLKIDSYAAGYGGAYYGASSETKVRQYEKGMLAVDIFNVKERRAVWHGVAMKNISEPDRENQEETVKAAVDAILAGFQPC